MNKEMKVPLELLSQIELVTQEPIVPHSDEPLQKRRQGSNMLKVVNIWLCSKKGQIID